MQIREEHRAGLMRGVGSGVVQFGVTTLGTYGVVDQWEGALVAGGIAGLLTIGAFFGLSVSDARRNDTAKAANP